MRTSRLRIGWRRLDRLSALLLAVALVAAPLPAAARHHARRSDAGGFDYYLLSLSLAPSFCALSAANQSRAECRTLTDDAFRRTPLTVHGLWPSRAFAGLRQQPQHCPGAPLTALAPELQVALTRFMPGGPGLARHEWRTRGTCSGLAPDAYFAILVRLAQSADGSIGGMLRDDGLLGHGVLIRDLLARIGRRDPVLARAVVVSCRSAPGSGVLIEEIRIALSKAFTPIAADSVGLTQSEGCPRGADSLPTLPG